MKLCLKYYWFLFFWTRCIVTFVVSGTVFEKFDVKQSNNLQISPRSSTVASCESCLVVVTMYVKCSEDSEQKKREFRIAIFNDHTHSMPPPQGTPANICINLILPETTFLGLHFCC